jgi:membrane protease YdiL (CAAX protease family)
MGDLEGSFRRRPFVTAVAVSALALLATGGGRALFGKIVSEGPHKAHIVAGLQQSALALIVIAVAARAHWLGRARILSRPHWPASRWALIIIPSGLIPLAAVRNIDWSQHATVLASVFDFVTTGIVEELIFRGVVLTGLSIGLAGRRHAMPITVVVSSALFGLLHLSPVVVVFATVYGLAFAHLAIGTRTIWIGVVVHALFDLFTDLPQATKQGGSRWYVPVALLFVLAGAVASVVRVWRNAPEFE